MLYWPDVAKREEPADYARRLTDHKKDGSFYNTSPAISPQGDKIAFITNRNDFFDVYVMNATRRHDSRQGRQRRDNQQLRRAPPADPGHQLVARRQEIAVATKAGEPDAILIIDVDSGDQEKLTLGSRRASSPWSGRPTAAAGLCREQGPSVGHLPLRSGHGEADQPDGRHVQRRASLLVARRQDASTSPRTAELRSEGHGHAGCRLRVSQADLYAVDIETPRRRAWSPTGRTATRPRSVASPDGKKVARSSPTGTASTTCTS